jgi:hypothetical protein
MSDKLKALKRFMTGYETPARPGTGEIFNLL